MRKFFQLAAVAALVMPVLVSCNPNDPNNPKKPNTPEGVLEYWTQPREDAALPVTVENMAGYWMLAYEATVDQGKNYATYSYDYEEQHLTQRIYWDLSASMTRTEYVIDTVYTYEAYLTGQWNNYRTPSSTTNTKEWMLKEDALHILNGGSIWTVRVLEQDRMVLSYTEDNQTRFLSFKRIQSIPTLPPSMADRLTQNAWRVAADTLIHSTLPLGVDDAEIINIETKILPANTILSFRLNDGNDHDQLIISEGTVENEKANYVCYITPFIGDAFVSVEVPDDASYRLPRSMNFRASIDPDKGMLVEETWEDEYTLTYRFYLEAVR